MKKVLFIVAPDKFRDEEYFQSKVMIQAKGIEILTAVKGDPEEVTGIKGGKARPEEVTWESLKTLDVDGVVVIGGETSDVYLDDDYLQEVLKRFASQGKVMAAICMTPAILAKAGLLEGKKCTADQSVASFLKEHGADLQDEDLVSDANFITAKSVAVALNFGKLIAEMVVSA